MLPSASKLIFAGMLLCDVPTPALILDHSTATSWRGLTPAQLDAAISTGDQQLQDLLYVHTTVLSGRDASAGPVGATTARTAATPVELARVDCSPVQAGGEDAYLALGISNDWGDAGYYWGRSTGVGAAMPAPGVALQSDGDGCGLRLVRLSNSNDGKRSEWAEFLRKGYVLQLVPGSFAGALASFDTVIGVCRVGEGVPKGAEPRVNAIWRRSSGSDGAWGRVTLPQVL